MPITINQSCGRVNGKTERSACCQKVGRFVTIQAKGDSEEEEALEIGKIIIKVAVAVCDESEYEENLCNYFDQPNLFDENLFNDDRNDGSCIPTTTPTSTTTTSTTTTSTSTTTICDPTPLRGKIQGICQVLKGKNKNMSIFRFKSSFMETGSTCTRR